MLCCVTGGMCAATSSSRVEKTSISGKEYTRLDQWARANSFQVRWLNKKDLLISSAYSRMNFTIDSHRLQFNGVAILLSEPVRSRSGVPYIASIDLSTAVHPILFPPRHGPKQRVKSICIDPGHGGKDPGQMIGREQEKKYTLLLAQELGEVLRKAGYTVSFTRTTDTFVELPVRADLARRRGADLFISLHFNSAAARDVQGAEVYCMTPQRASSSNARGAGANSPAYTGNANNSKNMLLAYQLQKAIVRGTSSDDRGVKRARFEVLREAAMPAVLVEAGFMSNAAEARNIFSATWRRKLAQSIANGVENYRKIVER